MRAGWTTGTLSRVGGFAADRPNSILQATEFCLTGALLRAQLENERAWEKGDYWHVRLERATKQVIAAVVALEVEAGVASATSKQWDLWPLQQWNDKRGRTKDEVLGLLDRALLVAEKRAVKKAWWRLWS